jgi:hypothetical protein
MRTALHRVIPSKMFRVGLHAHYAPTWMLRLSIPLAVWYSDMMGYTDKRDFS